MGMLGMPIFFAISALTAKLQASLAVEAASRYYSSITSCTPTLPRFQ